MKSYDTTNLKYMVKFCVPTWLVFADSVQIANDYFHSGGGQLQSAKIINILLNIILNIYLCLLTISS